MSKEIYPQKQIDLVRDSLSKRASLLSDKIISGNATLTESIKYEMMLQRIENMSKK